MTNFLKYNTFKVINRLTNQKKEGAKMKKLSLLIFLLFFTGFLMTAFADDANNPPVIKQFHAIFGDGYFTGFARIYDANDNLTSFEFGALYGVKFNGEKVQIGDGCGYTTNSEKLRHEGNGIYTFSVMYPSQKISNDFIYIVCEGKARDTDGNVTIKKIRGYPADLVTNKRPIKLSNFPNPFNPITTIEYSLNKTDNVKLSIYNILGQKVASLLNAKQRPGEYTIKFNGTNLPSGIYIIKLSIGNSPPLLRKIQLLK